MQDSKSMEVRALSGEGDTISRKMAIDAIEEMQMPIMRSEFSGEQFVFTGMAQALQAIKGLPSAQPERYWIDSEGKISALPSAQPQRKTGRWIRKTDTRFGEMLNDILICSECGIAFSTLNMIRRSYCPNCGARMDGEANE